MRFGKDAHLSLPSAKFELGGHRASSRRGSVSSARKASVSAAEYGVERRDIWLRDR